MEALKLFDWSVLAALLVYGLILDFLIRYINGGWFNRLTHLLFIVMASGAWIVIQISTDPQHAHVAKDFFWVVIIVLGVTSTLLLLAAYHDRKYHKKPRGVS